VLQVGKFLSTYSQMDMFPVKLQVRWLLGGWCRHKLIVKYLTMLQYTPHFMLLSNMLMEGWGVGGGLRVGRGVVWSLLLKASNQFHAV
jgi:hypothetical protein